MNPRNEPKPARAAEPLATIARRARAGYLRGLTCAHLRLVDAAGAELLVAYVERRGVGSAALMVAIGLPRRTIAAVSIETGDVVEGFKIVLDEHLVSLLEALHRAR